MVVGVPAPVIIQSSLYPIGNVYLNSSTVLNFTCTFSQIIKRPTTAASILLIDASTNLTVATLNSTNKRNVIIDNNTMVFTFGNLLQPFKTYYISISQGKLKKNFNKQFEKKISYQKELKNYRNRGFGWFL